VREPGGALGRQRRGDVVLHDDEVPGLLGAVGGAVPTAPTPWVAYPDRYTVQCTSAGGADWLQVTAAPGDARPTVAQTLGPTWGLHLYDFNIALGNLVSLVGHEAAAYGA
jgi:hypothetical protein